MINWNASHCLLTSALASIPNNPLVFDWRYENEEATPKVTGTIQQDFREILLLAGIAMSEATSASQFKAWFCLIRYSTLFTVNANRQLIASPRLMNADSHRLGLYADELGLGATIEFLMATHNVLAFADFTEYVSYLSTRRYPKIAVGESGKPIKKILSRDKRPDFVCYEQNDKWRLVEAKGSFQQCISKPLAEGKRQATSFKIQGSKARPSLVVGTLFPKTPSHTGRPKTISRDPEAQDPATIEPNSLILASTMMRQHFAFFGMEYPEADMLEELRARTTVIRNKRKLLPIYTFAGRRSLAIDSRILDLLTLCGSRQEPEISTDRKRAVELEKLLKEVSEDSRNVTEEIHLRTGFSIINLRDSEL